MSGIAFGLYACDKGAAERGGWRTSERTLHLVAFFGGWPGALLAQDLVRHKSRRPSFQAMSWCTAVANGAAVAWWLHAAR